MPLNPPDDKDHHDTVLREAANARLANSTKTEIPARSAEQLLHELQVHQIELEMQNETLRQSQKALAESRDRYLDLYEFAPVGYLTVDSGGKIEEINLTCVSLLRGERKKLLQTHFLSLVKAEDQSRWVRHLLNLGRGDGQDGVILAIQRRDRTLFHAKLDCVLIQGELSRQVGASSAIRIAISDVSDRIQAEGALRAERKRMRTILDVSSDPIFVKNNDHRVILANRAFYDLFGLDEDAVIGNTLVETDQAVEEKHSFEVDQRVLATGRPEVHEESRTLNGIERTIVTSKARFIEESGEKFLVCSIFDITDRKQAAQKREELEAQLRESQKMEAIGTLAGGIAHDFNNIVAAILGNAELAREDSAGNAHALESVEEIRKAATRARALVQQILSFSRHQPTELKVIALGPVVEETLRFLRVTLPPRITLTAVCDPDVPQVLADTTQIEQVLLNLVTNAVQAMSSGQGHIEIRLNTSSSADMPLQGHTALLRLHAKHPGRLVRLAVKDDGPGMDVATIARVFEPFFTTKPVGKGTGLGLAVAHGIVHKHEGLIEVHSQPGLGTTFTVYLPAIDIQSHAQALENDKGVVTPAQTVPSGKTILYVDDDGMLIQMVKKLLKRRGFRVAGYTDQKEALRALRADPAAVDLVLTDYNMPGMSGLDVAREVKACNPNMPVAVTSGFIDEELLAQAEGAGVSELIFKADDVDVFCESVIRALQKTT
jgi:two-component system, cell cycle sensor histidine kinase and response regulator CckA